MSAQDFQPSASSGISFQKGHRSLRSRNSKDGSIGSPMKGKGREQDGGLWEGNVERGSLGTKDEDEDEIDSLLRDSDRSQAKDSGDHDPFTNHTSWADPRSRPPKTHNHNLSSSSIFSASHQHSTSKVFFDFGRNGVPEYDSPEHPLARSAKSQSTFSLAGEDSNEKEDSGFLGNGFTLEKTLSTKSHLDMKDFAKEMILQTVPILTLTVVGGILVGELLEKLQTWRVFLRVEELFILVPILLNLKGNLEMNLAARFSTSANIGELDIRLTRRSLIFGNLALLQVQALFVSFFAGLMSFLLGLVSRTGVTEQSLKPIYKGWKPSASQAGLRGGYFECLLVLCASMLAASGSSAVAGSFMCSLVVLCRKMRVNPDNVATPVASCLGDLLTLTILGLVSAAFGRIEGTIVSTLVFVALLAFLAFEVIVTVRNAYVQELLLSGWTPLFIAMVISSATGLLLEKYVNEFEGYALLAPVVTSIAGNAGAIFVSRISTSLHANATHSERYTLTAITLTCISSVILMAFLLFVWLTGQLTVGLGFIFAYLVVVVIVSAISVTLAYQFSISLWRRDWDPDLHALPLLSSLMDVIGQLLLVAAYSAAGIRMAAAAEGGALPERNRPERVDMPRRKLELQDDEEDEEQDEEDHGGDTLDPEAWDMALADSDVEDVEEDDSEAEIVTRKKKRTDEPVPTLRPLKRHRRIERSIESLYEEIRKLAIDLNPQYQRDVVWPIAKQTKLIDSIYNNGWVPALLFNVRTAGDGSVIRTCMDGKQRLTSVKLFLEGAIPYKDPETGTNWYFSENTGDDHTIKGRRRLIPPHYQSIFLKKILLVAEYDDLEPPQEREMFSRVQLGTTLTDAEKLKAFSGPYARLAEKLSRRYIVDPTGNGLGDRIWKNMDRGKDYLCLVYLFANLVPGTPEPRHQTKLSMEKFLNQHKDDPSPEDRKTVIKALDRLEKLTWVEAGGKQVTQPIFIEAATYAPIEFCWIPYLIHRKSHWADHQLIAAIQGMHKMIHRKYPQNVSTNSTVAKHLLEYIKGLRDPGGLDHDGVRPTSAPAAKSAKAPQAKKRGPPKSRDAESSEDEPLAERVQPARKKPKRAPTIEANQLPSPVASPLPTVSNGVNPAMPAGNSFAINSPVDPPPQTTSINQVSSSERSFATPAPPVTSRTTDPRRRPRPSVESAAPSPLPSPALSVDDRSHPFLPAAPPPQTQKERPQRPNANGFRPDANEQRPSDGRSVNRSSHPPTAARQWNSTESQRIPTGPRQQNFLNRPPGPLPSFRKNSLPTNQKPLQPVPGANLPPRPMQSPVLPFLQTGAGPGSNLPPRPVQSTVLPPSQPPPYNRPPAAPTGPKRGPAPPVAPHGPPPNSLSSTHAQNQRPPPPQLELFPTNSRPTPFQPGRPYYPPQPR